MNKQNKRRNFDSKFKLKVAIEAIQEKQTLAELASKYEIFPTQVSDWKKEFLEKSEDIFESKKSKKPDKTEDVVDLYEQIGRLQMDIAYLKKKL